MLFVLSDVSLNNLNNGTWSKWSSWGSCSVSCGGLSGVQVRNRQCSEKDEHLCHGPASQIKQCVSQQSCANEAGECKFIVICA